MLDRLLLHGHDCPTDGDSYRIQQPERTEERDSEPLKPRPKGGDLWLVTNRDRKLLIDSRNSSAPDSVRRRDAADCVRLGRHPRLDVRSVVRMRSGSDSLNVRSAMNAGSR